jgi:hypothetical protein
MPGNGSILTGRTLHSPLILGNDVRNMSADDLSIVTNRDAIMVNQEVRACVVALV